MVNLRVSLYFLVRPCVKQKDQIFYLRLKDREAQVPDSKKCLFRSCLKLQLSSGF